ncbi:MAG: 2-succinyl-6-hydroxy-2,4-cyclohexadiene-1-carboxylate synthase [Alicyclobacillaceae bacterium]|nr:2-succinyl-6-hydroxy-2,4-cyclohexadiene-1-carboxylate synthase [Alicyclobacillaceae bacterium]MCY0895795.1 2-succinyl-6-hydroxy-2,4-cyclohexadiene-1-carboxylate synthase [Alicyclobacillaceae bacterium]
MWDVKDAMIRTVPYRVRMAGSGPPLLLLHGFSLSGEIFSYLASSLGAQYRLIAPDLLGHGETGSPIRLARYGTGEQVADLVELLSSLEASPAFVAGYSMGGRIALSLAMMAPWTVRKLVIESGSPGLSDPGERQTRRASDERLAERLESAGVVAFAEDWERLPLFASQRRADERERHLQAQIRRRQHAFGLANSLRAIGTGSQPSWWGWLHELDVPTLLVTGACDVKFTAIAESMRELLPDARHVVVAEAGHAVHLEQPSDFLQCVTSFLT